MKAFAADFDPQPFHLDDAAARDTLFGGLAASGWHTAGITMRLLVQGGLPIGSIIGAGADLAWPKPVRPGDTLRVESEILAIEPSSSRPGRGTITVRCHTLNQRDEIVQTMTTRLVMTRATQEAPPEPPNAAQIAFWNSPATAAWVRQQDRLDAAFRPIAEAALQAAQPMPGERVIDVGAGCGATVLALAERVGPSGHVLGLDISAPMLERAQARIGEAGLAQAEMRLADAATHALPPGEATLLFSRFGVMFFDDPAAAFANLRRGLRPGGRMLLAVWQPLTRNPWFHLPMDAIRPLLPPQPPPDPDAPGPFAFADPDRVRRIMTDSGWHDIGFAPRELALPIGRGEEAVDFALQVGPAARALAESDDATRAQAREAVRQAFKAHETAEGVRLGASIFLVSGTA